MSLFFWRRFPSSIGMLHEASSRSEVDNTICAAGVTHALFRRDYGVENILLIWLVEGMTENVFSLCFYMYLWHFSHDGGLI